MEELRRELIDSELPLRETLARMPDEKLRRFIGGDTNSDQTEDLSHADLVETVMTWPYHLWSEEEYQYRLRFEPVDDLPITREEWLSLSLSDLRQPPYSTMIVEDDNMLAIETGIWRRDVLSKAASIMNRDNEAAYFRLMLMGKKQLLEVG